MAVLFMLLGARRKQELLVIEMENVIVQTDKPILLPNKTLKRLCPLHFCQLVLYV